MASVSSRPERKWNRASLCAPDFGEFGLELLLGARDQFTVRLHQRPLLGQQGEGNWRTAEVGFRLPSDY